MSISRLRTILRRELGLLVPEDLHADSADEPRRLQESGSPQLRRGTLFDEALQYGDLQTGGTLVAFASHRLGEMLMPGHHAQGRPAGVELGFIANDVPAAFTKAVAEGAVPLAEPKVMPWGATVAYLRSPEGTILGLSTPIPGQGM